MSLLQTVILKLSEDDVEYLNFMVEAGGYESPSELVQQLIQFTRQEQTQATPEEGDVDAPIPQLEALYPLLGVPEAIDENGDPMWRGEQWRAAMERYEQGEDGREDPEPGPSEQKPE
jgi:Arc/MetJ-type ribon-helix-helix transcriptional regulator